MKATNSAVLVWGDSGSGKTSLLATAADYCWKTYKRKTRYYAGDLGGYNDNMLALQDAGIVEVWRFQSRDPDGSKGLAIGTCALITQGYWPKDGTWDPQSGLSDAGGELVAPSATWFVMKCKNGHQVKRVQSQTLLMPAPCPQCRVVTSKENCGGVEKEVVASESWKEVGLVVYDSLTSMGDWVMADMNVRAGRNELGGIKGSVAPVMSSGITFGTAGMSGVGFAQSRVADWPRNAVNIPGLVLPPIFTALEKRATDENKIPIYGPQVPGNAKTADVPSWFGNCWGTAKMTGDSGKEVHRLYLQGYRTPGDTIPHLCKSRVAPGSLPEYVQDPEGASAENGQSFTQFSLANVFGLLEEAQRRAEEAVRAKYPDAPGLGKKVEIGKKSTEQERETTTAGEGVEGNGEVAKASAGPAAPIHTGPVPSSSPAPRLPTGPPTRTVSPPPPSVGRPKGIVPGPRGTVVATVPSSK